MKRTSCKKREVFLESNLYIYCQKENKKNLYVHPTRSNDKAKW